MRCAHLIGLTSILLLGSLTTSSGAAPVVSECKGALAPSVPNGCQGVDWVGCCDTLGRQLWCSGGDLYCLDCNDGFPACGWNSLGYYDCGQEAGSQDPGGDHPLVCGGCPKACDGAPCSPDCAGACGVCEGGAICLDQGSCYVPQCEGKECGVDPMGFSCGNCGAGTECVAEVQKCLPYPEACVPKEGPGCEGCLCESCVCDLYPSCCTDGWDLFCATACEADCGMDCSACPLEPSCEGLQCGVFCGLDCGTCGDGQLCLAAQCCSTQCEGKECGPDGCGGVCGACEGFDQCNEVGICVGCQASCEGKICGTDGCGGSCGGCPDDTFCTPDGQCNSSLCAGQCGATNVDCGPDCNCFCDWECFEYEDCCDGVCDVCADAYVQQCCAPQCGDNTCGDDGCGGSCGDCESDSLCEEGQCVVCEPQCFGKLCGGDGCGGSCGDCVQGLSCTDDGLCEVCKPSCEDNVCGGDGCGGICSVCPAGMICEEGACVSDGECAHIRWTGCCYDGDLYYCDDNDLKHQNCGDDPCGWNPEADAGNGWFDCDYSGDDPSGEWPTACWEVCQPDCQGKECGGNGCGGSCGTCVEGTCEEGICVPPCVPDCLGRICGDDGCGVSCGLCSPGEGCTGDGLCSADCEPQCDGKVCGDDGCSASCGTCPVGHLCDGLGVCEDVPGCNGLTHEGVCHGSVVTWCEGENLQSYDCADVGKACAWVEGAGYTCVETATHCASSCSGRECGPDGCGGWCGICPSGEACIDGACAGPGWSKDEPGEDASGSPDGDAMDLDAEMSSSSGKGRSSGGCGGHGAGPGGPLLGMGILALMVLWSRRRIYGRS